MNNIINNDQHYYNSASNIESSTIKSELIIDEGIKQEYNEDTTADSYSINNDEGTGEYDYLQSDEQWVDEKTYLQRFLKSELTIRKETKEYNEGIKTKIGQEVKYDHHADIDNSIKVKEELQDDEYYSQRFMESEIKLEEYSSDIKKENQAENKFMDNKKTLIKSELLDDVEVEYDEDQTNAQEEDDIPVARFMKSEVTIEDEIKYEIQESKIAPNISSTMDIKKRFKCNTCDRVFAQLNGLKIHIRSHTCEKPFQCNECFKSFATSSYLTVHKRFHTGEKPYKCKICEKVFYDHSSLKRHFNFHIAEKIHKCTICGKAFSHQAKLETHCRVHSGEKPFKCTICFKTFGNDEWFKKHTRSHIKETVCLCTMCGIFIKSRSKLKQHERTHTGTKDHKCSYCDKEFLRKSALINHMRTHTGERPYECTTCQSKFRTHSALITHTNVIHKKIKTNKRR